MGSSCKEIFPRKFVEKQVVLPEDEEVLRQRSLSLRALGLEPPASKLMKRYALKTLGLCPGFEVRKGECQTVPEMAEASGN
mmetsp:Transcript_121122/g.287747  ORF Transcript_121122/g.287747 Transcript_121122/m.287747 type:complete len:81 (-) Transcript_121122:105-347(-)